MDARQWQRMGVAIAVLIGASQHARAEDGRPSRQVLDQMGFSGLVVLSDEEAMAVRGQGFKRGSSVQVFGNSFATIDGKNGGAHSENAYNAEGKHGAKGSNSSYAGVVTVISSGKHGKGDKGGGHVGKRPRGMGGGKHGGMNGGGYGRPSGGKPGYGGGHSGGGKPHGGTITVKATVFFAGGHSSGWAF